MSSITHNNSRQRKIHSTLCTSSKSLSDFLGNVRWEMMGRAMAGCAGLTDVYQVAAPICSSLAHIHTQKRLATHADTRLGKGNVSYGIEFCRYLHG